MPRRLRAALVALLVLTPLALVACAAPAVAARPRCPNPADRELLIDVMALRPVDGQGVGAGHRGATDPHYDVDLTIQALSPAPGFRGVATLGIPGINNVTPTNPGVIRRQTPWEATACWPASNPVALLIRVTMATVPDQANDLLSCFMEDGHALPGADFVDQQTLTAGPADLDLRLAPLMAVQCVDRYVPGDWTGEPLPTFNPLPPR